MDWDGEVSWSERVRKVRRKVRVMDATDHFWVGVAAIVGAVYRRCICVYIIYIERESLVEEV